MSSQKSNVNSEGRANDHEGHSPEYGVMEGQETPFHVMGSVLQEILRETSVQHEELEHHDSNPKMDDIGFNYGKFVTGRAQGSFSGGIPVTGSGKQDGEEVVQANIDVEVEDSSDEEGFIDLEKANLEERFPANPALEAVLETTRSAREEVMATRAQLIELKRFMISKGLSMAEFDKENIGKKDAFNAGNSSHHRIIEGRDEYGLPKFRVQDVGGTSGIKIPKKLVGLHSSIRPVRATPYEKKGGISDKIESLNPVVGGNIVTNKGIDLPSKDKKKVGDLEGKDGVTDQNKIIDTKVGVNDVEMKEAKQKSWANVVADKTSKAEGRKSWSQVLKADPPVSVKFEYHPLGAGESIVNPLDEVLKQGNEKFKFCAIGTFPNKPAPFHLVADFAKKLWRYKGLEQVLQKDSHVFLFKFNSEQSMNVALAGGTWYIDRKPMIMRPWGSEKCKPVTSMPIWIKLSNIPYCYWTKEGLGRLASAVGEPICADPLTSKLELIPFAKFCVKYTLGAPLPNYITDVALDPCTGEKYNAEIAISYFNKPLYCEGCKSLGHKVAVCPTAKITRVEDNKTLVENEQKLQSPVEVEISKPSTTPVDRTLGPSLPSGEAPLEDAAVWITVNRKRGHSPGSPGEGDSSTPSASPLTGSSANDLGQNSGNDSGKVLSKSQKKKLKQRSKSKGDPPPPLS